MKNFVETMKDIANTTYTDNGAKAYSSTRGGTVLDLFGRIGSMRSVSDTEIVSAWQAARAEDKELADNMVLYARDIRNGGCGERRVGRILLKRLAVIDPAKVTRNFDTIVDCGRWDDLFTFIGTPVEDAMWQYVKEQLMKDVEGMRQSAPISLAAKWMPSINTSSRDTRALAKKACSVLGLTSRTYRKSLSALRRYLDIVERRISAREWDKINFEAVPALAMNRYIGQFNAHCQEAFQAYKNAVVRGEAKVNAATLYPYDITQKFFNGSNSYWSNDFNNSHLDDIDEEQWKALPNYVNEDYDVLVLADVSGSMYCNRYRPLATSVGLATYFAQRNKGAYHDLYLTFTDNPHFIEINDNWTLEHTLRYVASEGMGYNTNLDKAFEAIYEVAKTAHEVPRALVVISDQQIDPWYDGTYCDSIASKWQRKYAEIDLEAPKLILWNVEESKGRVLARYNENVSYCSGYGIAPFKNLTAYIEKSAYEAMVEVLSKPAFAWK